MKDDCDLHSDSEHCLRKSNEDDPLLIITNGVDPIKKWTGAVSDCPPGAMVLPAKQAVEFKDRLEWPTVALPGLEVKEENT